MKNVILLIALVAAFAGCGHNDNNNNNAQVAALALPAECSAPVDDLEHHHGWDNYRHAGFEEYGWHGHHRFHHGGCPHGYFAACGAGVGMTCVPADIYYQHQVAWFNYQSGAPVAQFCGFEGGSNQGNCSYRSTDDGSGTIARTCIVGQPGSCPIGTCAAIDESSVGVCVQ